MIEVFLLFRGKWTVVWRKKIYTDSQHNMQKFKHKNNMSIIGTLGQITKASFRDSGLNQFILVQVTRWAIVCCMASYYTYQALLIIYRYAQVMISGSDLQVYMYSHFLIMSVELQVFFLLIQFVNSCKSNTLHWELVLSQSKHKAIQMLLSSDDVHIWTLYCYHMTSPRLLVFTHGRVTTVSPFPPAVFLFLGHPVL